MSINTPNPDEALTPNPNEELKPVLFIWIANNDDYGELR